MEMNQSDKNSCPCGAYISLFNNIYTILTTDIGYYYYFADEETESLQNLSNLPKVTELEIGPELKSGSMQLQSLCLTYFAHYFLRVTEKKF